MNDTKTEPKIKQIEFQHFCWFIKGAVYEYLEQTKQLDLFDHVSKDTIDKMWACMKKRPNVLGANYSDFQCTLWFQVRTVFGNPDDYDEVRIL